MMSGLIGAVRALFRRPEQKHPSPTDRELEKHTYCARLFEICVLMKAQDVQAPHADMRLSDKARVPSLDGFLFEQDSVPEPEGAARYRRIRTGPGHAPDGSMVLRVTPTLLRRNPRLQAKLAVLTAYTPGAWLLERELGARKENRVASTQGMSAADLGLRLNITRKELDSLEQEIDLRKKDMAAKNRGGEQETPSPAGGAADSGFPASVSNPSNTAHPLDAKAATLQALYETDIRTLVEMQGAGDAATLSPGKPGDAPLTATDILAAAARQNLAGLCLSGGGIRSATFSLGILQALASKQFLRRFDYLSTVSGGGYIHQWLAAWIRNGRDKGETFAAVELQLTPPADPGGPPKTPDPIQWLRRYSSYLTPQRGVLSVDTWTMLSIWCRNTLLNQLVLFSLIGCGLLASLAASHPFVLGTFAGAGFAARWWPALVLVGIVASTLRVLFALNNVTAPAAAIQNLSRWQEWSVGSLGKTGVFFWLVLPTFASAYLLALESVKRPPTIHGVFGAQPALVCFGVYLFCLLLAITFGGRAPRDFSDLVPDAPGLKLLAVSGFAASAAVFALLAVTVAGALAQPRDAAGHSPIFNVAATVAQKANNRFSHHTGTVTLHQKDAAGALDVSYTHDVAAVLNPRFDAGMVVATVLPPLLYFVFFVTVCLQVGVLGRFYAESRREWLARFGALGGLLGAVWIVLAILSRLGPVLFHWLVDGSTLRWGSALLLTVLVHAATLFAGASGRADGRPKPGTLLGYSVVDLVGIVGAPVCVLLLLILCSGLLRSLIDACNVQFQTMHPTVWQCGPGFVALMFLATIAFFGWRVDVNEFSMHGYYRNRLARGYLGAANARRMPDPFTGFDDHNETNYSQTGIRLAELLPDRFGGPGKYDGPFPIFCSTLNLNFGEDLAWQERKGASFAFTPMFSGYHVGWSSEGEMGRLNETDVKTGFNGYVRTPLYAYPDEGVGLSTVTAICGAALSPNQGYNSQPALAFLMTLFNVRLGWWIANPRRYKVWPAANGRPTPTYGMWYLLQELLGLADDTQNYVFLSDGGHFENMGMYELVRRRCRLIVVCDGEMDNGPKFEGIGNAIAKCRTDFGAEITLDLNPLIPDAATGFAKQHCVWGTIRYPAPPMSTLSPEDCVGYVIYLKTSITGTEPGDILHHRLAHPDFPQDTTLNQWFTESQFESYRRLGQVVGEEAYRSISACAAALAAGGAPLQPPS